MRTVVFSFGLIASLFIVSLTLSFPTETPPGITKNKSKLILFVHGYTGSRESWTPFLNLLNGDNALQEFDTYVMEYPTRMLLGWNNRSIRQIGELLKTQLIERFAQYKEVYLVGHSMGGLVICSMVIEQLKANRASDLKRISHIILFGTPNNGKQIPRLLGFFDRQLSDISSAEQTVEEIRNEWINRVYAPRVLPGDESSKLHIPVTVVVGLEDDIVDEGSARSFFRDPPPLTVPGNHTSMKEPDSRDALAYIIVKNRLISTNNLPDSVSGSQKERMEGRDELLVIEYAKQKEQACDKVFAAGKELIEAQKITDDDQYVRSLTILNPRLEHWQSACNYWELQLAKKEGREPVKFSLPLPPNRPSHLQVSGAKKDGPQLIDSVIDLAIGEPFGSKTVIILTNSGVQPVVNVAVNLRCFFLKSRNDLTPPLFFAGFPSIGNQHSWWRLDRIDPTGISTKDARETLEGFLKNTETLKADFHPSHFEEIILAVDIVYERESDHKRYEWSGIARLVQDSRSQDPFLIPISTTSFYRAMLRNMTAPNYRTAHPGKDVSDETSLGTWRRLSVADKTKLTLILSDGNRYKVRIYRTDTLDCIRLAEDFYDVFSRLQWIQTHKPERPFDYNIPAGIHVATIPDNVPIGKIKNIKEQSGALLLMRGLQGIGLPVNYDSYSGNVDNLEMHLYIGILPE